LWSLVGRALHKVAEEGADEQHIAEERLFAEVRGWLISGGIDVQHVQGNSWAIADHKFTAAYSLMMEKPEWEYQLNMYAWLCRKVKGWDIVKLTIWAYVRDWSRWEAKKDPMYPAHPINVVPVRLWSEAEQDEYVNNRVLLHQQANAMDMLDEPLPPCTDQERWMRPTKFAVMKPGAKRALRVFEGDGAKKSAGAYCGTHKGTFVLERKGEPVRCAGDYCRVSKWCDQYKGWLDAVDSVGRDDSNDVRGGDGVGDPGQDPEGAGDMGTRQGEGALVQMNQGQIDMPSMEIRDGPPQALPPEEPPSRLPDVQAVEGERAR
jgi:hypothetical protein